VEIPKSVADLREPPPPLILGKKNWHEEGKSGGQVKQNTAAPLPHTSFNSRSG